MRKGINAWTFDPNVPLREAARRAAAAGFAAFEPVVTEAGELRLDTDEATCRALGEAIRDAGLEVASLACGMFWQCNYGSRNPADREKAREMTIALLERAEWIGAPAVLVVPAVVGRWNEPLPRGRYADCLNATQAALRTLWPEAEARGVHIALENVWNRFLLSPVEVRGLLDCVNSPWVGAYLDIGNVMQYGYPQDWIETLGRRIVRVHVKDYKLGAGSEGGFRPLGEGDVDWPAVMAALRHAWYDGPLIYEGSGDLDDISARMDRVLGLSVVPNVATANPGATQG